MEITFGVDIRESFSSLAEAEDFLNRLKSKFTVNYYNLGHTTFDTQNGEFILFAQITLSI